MEMKNITTAKSEAIKAGFEIQKSVCGCGFDAVKKDELGRGIRARFRFNRSAGKAGKPLQTILVSAFPFFNGSRALLVDGARSREFSATRSLSNLFPEVEVRTCGVQTALFRAGKFEGKF
jgi:hypothetical protein